MPWCLNNKNMLSHPEWQQTITSITSKRDNSPHSLPLQKNPFLKAFFPIQCPLCTELPHVITNIQVCPQSFNCTLLYSMKRKLGKKKKLNLIHLNQFPEDCEIKPFNSCSQLFTFLSLSGWRAFVPAEWSKLDEQQVHYPHSSPVKSSSPLLPQSPLFQVSPLGPGQLRLAQAGAVCHWVWVKFMHPGCQESVWGMFFEATTMPSDIFDLVKRIESVE